MRDLEANILSGAEETKLQYEYMEKEVLDIPEDVVRVVAEEKENKQL